MAWMRYISEYGCDVKSCIVGSSYVTCIGLQLSLVISGLDFAYGAICMYAYIAAVITRSRATSIGAEYATR